jgi:hypothetical protein
MMPPEDVLSTTELRRITQFLHQVSTEERFDQVKGRSAEYDELDSRECVDLWNTVKELNGHYLAVSKDNAARAKEARKVKKKPEGETARKPPTKAPNKATTTCPEVEMRAADLIGGRLPTRRIIRLTEKAKAQIQDQASSGSGEGNEDDCDYVN